MKKLYLIIVITLIFILGLTYNIIQFATNFRPNFICGDDNYYIFPDVEGVDIITNSSNTEFKYDLFPSIFYRSVENKYPYRVYLKYNNSKYINK
jgi:hypothetical protein